jgi:nucleotide-binding universal stress UspA family protein
MKGEMLVKILVCIDGSENSLKCAEFASQMVDTCHINEVNLIYVHDSSQFFPDYWQGKYPFTPEEENQIKKLDGRLKEERKKIFSEALKYFEDIPAKIGTLIVSGHPAEAISEEASKGNYQIVVIGRRGTGGFKKLFMGSVSSSVLQMVKTNVLIVK